MAVRLKLPFQAKLRLAQDHFQNLHTLHSDSFGDISSKHLKSLKILEEVFIYLQQSRPIYCVCQNFQFFPANLTSSREEQPCPLQGL